jgi:putative transposase
MAKPARNSCAEATSYSPRTFFATTKTHGGRRLLQSERNATLLIDVLRTSVAAKNFQLHDFVVMPDHIHLLITVDEQTTIEKAMQLIKGRFSYRLKKEQGYLGEVWQRGFSEVHVDNETSFRQFREYIAQNPVKAGLSATPGEYPFCFGFLASKKASRGLKPNTLFRDVCGRSKLVP